MSSRYTPLLILLTTLVAGMVLGALIHAQVARDRIDQIGRVWRGDGFVRSMEQTVKPIDDAQRQDIQNILKRYGPETQEIFSDSRERMQELMQDLERDLEDVLTDEQMDAFRSRAAIQKPGPPPFLRDSLRGFPPGFTRDSLGRLGPPGFLPDSIRRDSLRRLGPRGLMPDSIRRERMEARRRRMGGTDVPGTMF